MTQKNKGGSGGEHLLFLPSVPLCVPLCLCVSILSSSPINIDPRISMGRLNVSNAAPASQ
jgi:hypothetical protein